MTVAPFTGGNGGAINVTAAGPIKIDSPIEATTGYVQSPLDPHGNGGTVNLTSTNDSVAVNSRIEVSSADRRFGEVAPAQRNRWQHRVKERQTHRRGH